MFARSNYSPKCKTADAQNTKKNQRFGSIPHGALLLNTSFITFPLCWEYLPFNVIPMGNMEPVSTPPDP
jgi:hypothetical protein